MYSLLAILGVGHIESNLKLRSSHSIVLKFVTIAEVQKLRIENRIAKRYELQRKELLHNKTTDSVDFDTTETHTLRGRVHEQTSLQMVA